MSAYFNAAMKLQDAANDALHAHAVEIFSKAAAKSREHFAIDSLRHAASLLGFDLVERSTVINPATTETEPANFDWKTMTIAPDNQGGNHETQVATAADLVSTGAQHLSSVAPYTNGLSGRV